MARFIAVVSMVTICDFSIVATCPSIPAAPFALSVCVKFVLFLFFVVVLTGKPGQKQGRGLVDCKLGQAPSNFIAGRLKAALLFWLFGDI